MSWYDRLLFGSLEMRALPCTSHSKWGWSLFRLAQGLSSLFHVRVKPAQFKARTVQPQSLAYSTYLETESVFSYRPPLSTISYERFTATLSLSQSSACSRAQEVQWDRQRPLSSFVQLPLQFHLCLAWCSWLLLWSYRTHSTRASLFQSYQSTSGGRLWTKREVC